MIGDVLSRESVYVFFDVANEWEEAAAKYFNVPISKIIIPSQRTGIKSSIKALHKGIKSRIKSLIKPFIPSPIKQTIKARIVAHKHQKRVRLAPVLSQDIEAPLSLYFPMAIGYASICVGRNCLPVFCDIWAEEIDVLLRMTQNLKLFYVTSRDVFNLVKAKSPSSNVRYMPLSVSDKYHSENFAAYREKYIDVFMPGRGNPVLHEYMLKYSAEHPNIKYAYRTEFVYKRGNLECRSTDGSICLPLNTREDYMYVLSSAKVSLVGCSGIDNARPGTNGICFVTPRFYESAILGCALIGRYPDNQEFTELNMRRYCPNITSYEHFCEALEHALAQSPEELYAQNRDFISNSLTSKRAEQIQHDLEAIS